MDLSAPMAVHLGAVGHRRHMANQDELEKQARQSLLLKIKECAEQEDIIHSTPGTLKALALAFALVTGRTAAEASMLESYPL